MFVNLTSVKSSAPIEPTQSLHNGNYHEKDYDDDDSINDDDDDNGINDDDDANAAPVEVVEDLAELLEPLRVQLLSCLGAHEAVCVARSLMWPMWPGV